ncbi:MAG: S9 family peptidase, partial [Bdellovibrionales bacterium]|nr:S9 family peptidase [Bdellovibrionales bacterium]
MKSFPFSLLLCLPLISLACTQKPTSDEANQAPKDPYLWLEDVEGAKAMDWVKEQNKKSLAELTKTPRFKSLESEALGILQSKDKIPMVSDIGGKHVYNFWQDDKHVRGLWRRTTLTSYKQKRPKWETLLDLDQVAKADKENWVFKGANCLQPQYERCLIYLSRGGKDAIVVKEFSIASKSFVKNGFELPEAKSWVGWYDSQNMFVATDFGAGSMTESGYPRIVKLWKRGTDLSQAKTVFEGTVKDMAAYGTSLFNPEGKISLVTQLLDFYSDKTFVYSGQKLIQVPKPDSAKLLGYFKGFFILELRKPWEVEGLQFAAGSLVAMQKGAVKAGSVRGGDLQLVYSPDEKSSLLTAAILKDRLVLN